MLDHAATRMTERYTLGHVALGAERGCRRVDHGGRQ